MDRYAVVLTISVEADSKIEALDRIKELFGDLAEIDISDEVNSDLFAELGVDYD
jgi:hypothetical protein